MARARQPPTVSSGAARAASRALSRRQFFDFVQHLVAGLAAGVLLLVCFFAVRLYLNPPDDADLREGGVVEVRPDKPRAALSGDEQGLIGFVVAASVLAIIVVFVKYTTASNAWIGILLKGETKNAAEIGELQSTLKREWARLSWTEKFKAQFVVLSYHRTQSQADDYQKTLAMIEEHIRNTQDPKERERLAGVRSRLRVAITDLEQRALAELRASSVYKDHGWATEMEIDERR